jgi:hypothetical protein
MKDESQFLTNVVKPLLEKKSSFYGNSNSYKQFITVMFSFELGIIQNTKKFL